MRKMVIVLLVLMFGGMAAEAKTLDVKDFPMQVTVQSASVDRDGCFYNLSTGTIVYRIHAPHQWFKAYECRLFPVGTVLHARIHPFAGRQSMWLFIPDGPKGKPMRTIGAIIVESAR